MEKVKTKGTPQAISPEIQLLEVEIFKESLVVAKASGIR